MTLCGFEIAPGEKQQVKLPVPAGSVAVLRNTLRENAGDHSWGAWL